MRNYIKAFFAILIVFFLVWSFGFIWFAQNVPESPKDQETEVDAIVVLTGGGQRLETGIELLKSHKGKRLFVTGVDEKVDIDSLKAVISSWPQDLQNLIDLGYEAKDTRENSLEAKEYMKKMGFSSLRLVTSSYHVKRSMAEFKAAMPEIHIIANPVIRQDVHSPAWWQSAFRDNLIVGEYHKYVLARLRIYVAQMLQALPL